MMLDWQDLVALSLVLLAVVYLGFQLWRVLMRKQSAGCGTCAGGNCSEGTGPKEKQLVTIDSLSLSETRD